MSQFKVDDQWQQSIIDRFVKPVLSNENTIVFFGHESGIDRMAQHKAHVDAVVQMLRGSMSIEFKMRRWPRLANGTALQYDYPDFLLEVWSRTTGPSEYKPLEKGWLHASNIEWLLYGQVSFHEDFVDCWPLPFEQLKQWARKHWRELAECFSENWLNGTPYYSVSRLAPKLRVCRDLRIEGFRIQDGLIGDMYGKPLLRFMHQRPGS
jgi:hypothetical protein